MSVPSSPLSFAMRWQALQAERARIEEAEAALLRDVLDAAGSVSAAARAIGVPRTTLASRIGKRQRETEGER